MTMKRIGLVGARGHVGQELLALVAAHGQLELDFVVSREWAGQEVVVADDKPFGRLRYEHLSPEAITRREVDAIVLALPNGRASRVCRAGLPRKWTMRKACDSAKAAITMRLMARLDARSWPSGFSSTTRTF